MGNKNNGNQDDSEDEYIPCTESSNEDFTSESESSDANQELDHVNKKLKTFHRASSIPPKLPSFTLCLINNNVENDSYEEDQEEEEDNLTEESRRKLTFFKNTTIYIVN